MDQSAAKRMTITTLQNACEEGEKIAVLTCYDATFAAVLEAAGGDIARECGAGEIQHLAGYIG